MASVRRPSFWFALGLTAAGCTAIANGHLSDKPSEGGEGGGGQVSAPKQALGTPCDENDDCASGSCTDEVCCDQACVGGCVSCNHLGLYGTCVPLTGSEGDCDAGELCSANGVCTPVDGEGCTDDEDCESGFCTDGVCCDERCDGSCESCIIAQTGLMSDGICAVSIGDFDGDCAGTVCIAKGQCCGAGVPPETLPCPPECTGGCAEGVCTIRCPDSACKDDNIICPAGFDCHVECPAHDSCKGSTIDCPTEHACEVTCGGIADHGCENVTITCTNGPCAVECIPPGDPCKGATVHCGNNACDAICDGNKPAVDCDTSCRCQGCP